MFTFAYTDPLTFPQTRLKRGNAGLVGHIPKRQGDMRRRDTGEAGDMRRRDTGEAGDMRRRDTGEAGDMRRRISLFIFLNHFGFLYLSLLLFNDFTVLFFPNDFGFLCALKFI